jgi:hypothetical protein
MPRTRLTRVRASRQPDDDHVYTPTTGTVSGWTGLVIAGAFVLAVLLGDWSVGSVRYAVAALIFALLMWCYMLRPRVVIGGSEVELRNPFSSWHVPLVDVRSVEVRAVTMLTTEERRYDGVAVGRPARTLLRGGQQRTRFLATPGRTTRLPNEPEATRLQRGQLDANAIADLVVEQVLFGADQARERGETSRPARRSWASLEIGGLVALVATFVVSLLG